MEVNTEVQFVDREDQVKWFLDPETALSFCIQLDNNHRDLRTWLRSMTVGAVVVSAQGVMPRVGTSDHPYHGLLCHVQKNQFKVYFENEQDALAFKLAWGGSL